MSNVVFVRARLVGKARKNSVTPAGASLLQKQLEEKDDLLQEVSKLPESVEIRQSALECENQ